MIARLTGAKSLIIILCCVQILLTSPASAQRVVRDSEIENTLRYFTNPLIESAGLDKNQIQLHMILDDSINAFVTGGQNIFINSGLVLAADEPEQVISVIAHELGHIAAGHLVSLTDDFRRARNIGLIGTALAIPLALLSGQGQAALGGALVANETAKRAFLAHSRDKENSADQYALSMMSRNGYRVEAMYNFMQKLAERERLYGVADPFSQTHPVTRDRLQHIKSWLETNPPRVVRNDRDTMNYIYGRIRAKIFGYTKSVNETLSRYPRSDQSEFARYGRTFAYLRAGQHENALHEIDALLAIRPDDIFYLETKADILFHDARLEEAAMFYRLVIDQIPWTALVRLSLARTLLQNGDDQHLPEVLEVLQAGLQRDPSLASLWRQLAVTYGRMGDFAQVHLAQSEEALLMNMHDRALGLAELALDELPKDSSSFFRARDILNQLKPDN